MLCSGVNRLDDTYWQWVQKRMTQWGETFVVLSPKESRERGLGEITRTEWPGLFGESCRCSKNSAMARCSPSQPSLSSAFQKFRLLRRKPPRRARNRQWINMETRLRAIRFLFWINYKRKIVFHRQVKASHNGTRETSLIDIYTVIQLDADIKHTGKSRLLDQ